MLNIFLTIHRLASPISEDFPFFMNVTHRIHPREMSPDMPPVLTAAFWPTVQRPSVTPSKSLIVLIEIKQRVRSW